jgi:hypothetical protein
VNALKKDNAVRICDEYKVTVNPQLDVNSYPLPGIDDMFARLSGGKLFSLTDLSQAYLQIKLANESKQYMVINTPRDLYQYQRLP